MRRTRIALLALAAAWTARADFSYTMTQKSAMGSGNEQVIKQYIKGDKLVQDRGNDVMIWDFGAQTETSINKSAKTYTVRKFSDLGGKLENADVNVDIKNTGQKKVINGFNATQILLTMEIDMPQARQAGMKPVMEMEFWVSNDVPGAQEMIAFYRRNAAKFPAAMVGGRGAQTNPSIQKAMLKMQQAIANVDGVPVLQIVRLKLGGGMSAEQMEQMARARAQLEDMAKRGGAQAQAAQAAMARMGAAGGAGFETTLTSSDFSRASVPDSAVSVPAGFTESK